MQNKPIVDGLAAEYRGRIEFVRVDLFTDAGQALAARYNLHATPSFVGLVDKQVVWQQSGTAPTRDRLESMSK